MQVAVAVLKAPGTVRNTCAVFDRGFDWERFGEDAQDSGAALLAGGVVPGPPSGPFVEGRAYPLAVDVDSSTAAVSYAALNPYPDLEPGWWCVAVRFSLMDGAWRAGDETDNCTTQRPFERPSGAQNSQQTWVDWHSSSGVGDYGQDEPRYRHMLFGIAPAATARLTVTDETDRDRDLVITRWCGAYVATVEGSYSRLTGYDHAGRSIGSFICEDGLREDGPPSEPELEPTPGCERVQGPASGVAEPILWRKTEEGP
jgi:hypothetical protein